MTYNEFKTACDKLKDFFAEQDRLQKVVEVISPDSNGVIEFGNWFVDAYVNLMAIALNDEHDWVSWFVFDNDFGRKKLSINDHPITNEKTFYNFIIKK